LGFDGRPDAAEEGPGATGVLTADEVGRAEHVLARADRSPRLPIGVATNTSEPPAPDRPVTGWAGTRVDPE